jgi:hypothetical protein
LAVESSGIGSGGRASARLPCWPNIRIAGIGRGFHGLSNGCVAPRWRGNPWALAVLPAAALATGQPVPVLAATPVTHVTATAAMAAPDTNLLLNPEATVGATSAQGWDAVTIPGWQVVGGLPAIVRYGPPDFRKPPKPGRPTAVISSPAAPTVPRPAPPNSPFSSRAQAGEFSPPSRSGLPGRPSPISA